MELRHLQTFAAVAELESFTKAAESLDVTQAAASQSIRGLEKQLGVVLFKRGRKVSLTPAGRQLYDYARKILDLVEEATHVVGNEELGVRGTMRIASSTVPAEWLLPQLLADFHACCPGVRVSVAVSDSAASTREVEAGESDIGFVGELPCSSGLESREIAADELVLVVSSDNPLASRKSLSLKDLCKLPIIVREAGSGSRRCVERALEAAGVRLSDLTIAMEVNSNEAIRAVVGRGMGAAFLSSQTVDEQAGLAPVAVRGLRVRRRLYVISKRDAIATAPVREFLAFLSTWEASPNGKRGRAATR